MEVVVWMSLISVIALILMNMEWQEAGGSGGYRPPQVLEMGVQGASELGKTIGLVGILNNLTRKMVPITGRARSFLLYLEFTKIK